MPGILTGPEMLGVPMAVHKREGPVTCIVFLGIEVDTIAGELRLPEEKMERLQALLQEWGDRRACSCKEFARSCGQDGPFSAA